MKDPLLSLAPSELRALAMSVRKGRVLAPYSALSLQQIVGEHAAESVSRKLDLLSASEMSSEALCVCLELTADALSSDGKYCSAARHFDIVTTESFVSFMPGPTIGRGSSPARRRA